MSKARDWDRVVLPVLWWSGPLPFSGDALKTSTGRTYLIVGIQFRTRLAPIGGSVMRALECVVLPPGEKVKGTTFDWQWGERVSRKRRAPPTPR